jgi:hypothetical protein
MIKKDDVMELHDTIKAIELRQEHTFLLAFNLMADLKGMGEMIEVLKKEYIKLKEKAEE